MLTPGLLFFLLLSDTVSSFFSVDRHRVNLDFIRSPFCVPMALTAERPPAQDQ